MTKAPPRYWVIYLIIAVCSLIEIVLVLGDLSIIPIPRLRQTAYEYAGFWPGLLGPWTPNYKLQPILMFLTYAVLHGGILHLIFNMITLFSLGKVIVDRVGQAKFLLIFGGSVLGGALGFGLLTNAPNPMVGASGGLFGLAGAVLLWNYIDRFVRHERLVPVLQAVLALVLLNIVLWWLMDGHLAWQTHLGGFVSGWIIAMLVDPRGEK